MDALIGKCSYSLSGIGAIDGICKFPDGKNTTALKVNKHRS